MTIFTSTELSARGRKITMAVNRSADVLLKEFSAAYKSAEIYDIFLSHSYRDAGVILGLKGFIEDLGYKVYVDWIEDAQLDRTAVTKATAKLLKERMKSCKSLFYAFSINSPRSIWMPWELGVFDGIKGMAALLPINDNIRAVSEF